LCFKYCYDRLVIGVDRANKGIKGGTNSRNVANKTKLIIKIAQIRIVKPIKIAATATIA